MTDARLPMFVAQFNGGGANDRMLIDELQLQLDTKGDVEWLVADVSLARAFFEGVPAARLLARTRLASDERDLSTSPLGSTPIVSTWDTLMKRLLERSGTFDRVKRQVARQTRAASDEGPLEASQGVVAALAYAVACAQDADASLAETVADRPEHAAVVPTVGRDCGVLDGRLSRAAGVTAAVFEACVRMATRASSGVLRIERVIGAHRALQASELALRLVRPSNIALYPRDLDADIAPADRRMVLVERAELDALMTRDPRELAGVVARIEDGASRSSSVQLRPRAQEPRGLDSLLADLGKLLAHPGDLVLAVPLAEPPPDDELATSTTGPASLPSWLPTTWSSPEAGAVLAEAFERGSMTLPRMRAAVLRGGDQALDALGAEMLRAADHPFASAAFAELLARSGRARDVVRLVTYFAVAPDPELAARALSTCPAPELPTVLRSWLESMLPTDGEPALLGEDPQTSSAARLTACVSSLAPYPHLYRAVRPLLARVSEPPPSS